MPKNSFLKALFSGPKFSLAPIEKNNRGTVKIGQVVPVWSTVLNPREGVELNMAHLLRFFPAKAPVMEGYKVTFDAFAVPYSTLGYAERKERDIDDFFNIKENAGTVPNPFCFSMSRLQSMLGENFSTLGDEGINFASAFKLGSLGDYINFPSLKGVREHVRKWLQFNPLAYGSNLQSYFESDSDNPLDSLGYSVASFVALAYLNDEYTSSGFTITIDLSGRGHGIGNFVLGVPFVVSDNPLYYRSGSYFDNPEEDVFYTSHDDNSFGYQSLVGAYSLLGYILRNYPAVASYYGFVGISDEISINQMANHIAYLMDEDNPISLDYLQVLYDNYKIDAQSIYNEYFEYILSKVLYNSNLVNSVGENLYGFESTALEQESLETFLPCLSDEEPIDLSYLAAYWKIISDWYINTNIDGDPDNFFLQHCHILTDEEATSLPARFLDLKPFVRRWANDIFTSSVPMAQVNNIRIPADGTIPDLREANAYQKLVDIFRNTGNRLRDVIYGVFGITPSAVRSEMSEPIGSCSSWVGMQSVLQTSQTTPDSPQAAYAGIGTDSSGFKRILKYVNNDEPTPVIVMVLMSVTQRASYMQGFDRKFFRSSIYDFAIPELAMIGEQEVTNKELYFDKGLQNGVFGFNRRYYDWFYDGGSEVHGEFRDTLDYWHGARIFDEQPALNSEFIGIESDIDHLQRVFANTSESAMPIVYNLSFDGSY